MELNLENLKAVLQQASATERGQNQQAAEAQLKSWESVKGFHFLLQSVYIDTNQPLQIRWLAIIYLKNDVDKFWRASRVHAIQKDEKLEIRNRLFDVLDESNNQLTIQNAHTIAKIARYDFPTEWQTIFETFANILENSDKNIIRVNNTLLILNQVLKVLASIRIGRGRIAMQSKITLITPFLIKYYHTLFDSWTTSFDPAIMEVGYMSLKTLRRSIVDGYDYPQKDKLITEFFETCLHHFQKLLVQHENYSHMELLERYIKCYVKLFYNLIYINPTSFLLMPSSNEILITLLSILQNKAPIIYNNNINNDDVDESTNEFWEQIAVKTFLILKRLTTFAYKKGALLLKQKNDKEEIEKAINYLTKEFFTESLLENLVSLIIDWYLKLKPSDLESWSVEPEEWVNEELQLSWEYQIRPCAENYFQDLASFFKSFLSKLIMEKIVTGINNTNNNEIANILQKDSIFAVFQLSANAITDYANFDELFEKFFLIEGLKEQPTENKIIRRRVCLIVSEWISLQCSKNTRDNIYKMLLTFLRNDSNGLNDIVVKLTSIQTLQHMIDDWEFRKKDFQPYLNEIVISMLNTLTCLNLAESKIFVLKVLSVLIERNNPLIPQETLINIMRMIPIMWEKSNNPSDMIIKNSLLRVLRDLTTSLNKESDKIHEIVLPLISISCNPNSEYYSLLCEDGFELWQSILKNIPITTNTNNGNLPDQLITDFPLIIKGLMEWTEILQIVLSILSSYSLLKIQLFSSTNGLEIFKILGGYLSSMRNDSLYIFGSMMEVLILQLPSLTNITDSIFISNYLESGLFNSMITFFTRETESPVCETKIAIPICRLIYSSSNIFLEMLNHISTTELSTPILINKIIKSLVNLLKLCNESKIRKIILLALLKFYELPNLLTTNPSTIIKSITELKKSTNTNIIDDDYYINNVSQDFSNSISFSLINSFDSILYLLVNLLETVSEDVNTGDNATYHRSTAYDDSTSDFVLITNEDEESLEDNENGDSNDEYRLEYLLPPNGEKLRYNKLIMEFDPVHKIPLKEYTKNVINNLNERLGHEEFNSLMQLVNSNNIEQLQMMIK
ncbi:hypothetical protein B5S28_g3714 [[Candida] boidinii]|nr:hypothetical protein B5S28_g3714 [[Candida] boidinii]OWB73977.1 hypothetical protein B5S31_g3747 [[Candida] boidinii]